MALPVLAIDLGGTKILAALVEDARIVASTMTATDRNAGPEGWLDQIAALVRDWSGSWQAMGITVTGFVRDGMWSALSRATLDLPGAYPLAERAAARLGGPVTLANDAQAAAWGEFRHGAGAGCRDMVFLTVSTGIGGGIIADGRLIMGRSGMAGHVGLLAPLPDGAETIFETRASGRWIAEASGHKDARGAFADPAAAPTIALSAARVGRLCQNLQLLTDPDRIVIGGGVGLAPGYLAQVTAALAPLPDQTRPTLAPAALGIDAGVIGIAALTQDHHQQRG